MLSDRIGKIPVKRELSILDKRVDREMESFNWLGAGSDASESFVQLGQSRDFYRDMELAKHGRTQTELASRKPPSVDEPLGPEISQIGPEPLRELRVANAGL